MPGPELFTEARGPRGEPPHVFLHGTPGDRRDWEGVVAHAKDRHVLLVDLPDHGQAPRGDFSNAAMLDAVQATVGELGQPAVLVGHSYGAWLAAHLAARSPALVHRVVLTGGFARFDEETAEARRQMTEALEAGHLTADALLPSFAELCFGQDGASHASAWLERMATIDTSQALRLARRALEIAEPESDVPPFDAPALVIHGRRDAATPPSLGRTLAARARQGTFHLVDTDSHMLPISHPDVVARAVFEGEEP